ncbi:oligosaccharide flippase family protein [Clostridium sp. HBUAS56017]|uniref:lipopolysaccharide biosynthesis protein n=1 Tax=Clostridium sp. HBUAS56017 TaxID=2571128 RepID=UPI00163DA4EB|nr:oligosaccharide flippase family protein [Clostridium sp. HBUAS56017]
MLKNIKKVINYKGDSLLVSASWYTVGTFLLRGISFFTIPLYTKVLGMNTSDYGINSVYLTYLAVATAIVGLGINSTLGVAKITFEKDFDAYISSVLFLSTLSFLSILVGTIFIKDSLSNFTQLAAFLLILMVVQSFFDFITSFYTNKLVFEKKYKQYLLISIISTLLNIIASIVIISMFERNKYIGKILAGVISSLGVGIFLYMKMIIKTKFKINIEYWKFCIPIALPIVLHSLSSMILSQADRVMLQKYTDDASVGVYGMAYNIGMIVSTIFLAINNAWIAWYYNALKDNLVEEIREKSKKYINVFTIFIGVYIFISPELMKLLASKDFWVGIDMIPIIILGHYFIFLYTFSVNYEFYMKKTRHIAIGTVVAAILNILLNCLFIPLIGGKGAALSTAISYGVLFLFHYIIVEVLLKHEQLPFKYYISLISIIVLVIIINYFILDSIFLRFGCALLVIVASLYKYKEAIKI